MPTNDDIPPWVNDPDIPTDTKFNSGKPAPQGEKLHTIHGYIHAETSKAILLEIRQINDTSVCDPGEEGIKHWFPLSQTRTISRGGNAVDPSAYDYIRVTDWIAKAKELV